MKNIFEIKKIINFSLFLAFIFLAISCNQDEATTPETENYSIEIDKNNSYYVGRSRFWLWYKNNQTGQYESGHNISIKSKMTMNGVDHYDPVDFLRDFNNGAYGANIYFTMPTNKSADEKNGDPSIDIYKDNVLVKNYPVTVDGSIDWYGYLKGGQNDSTYDEGKTNRRIYYLFQYDLDTSAPCHATVEIYLTTIAQNNLDYLPVFIGQTLTDQNQKDWNVQDVLIQVSLDGTNWITLSENLEKKGYFYTSNLDNYIGLNFYKYYIKLFINNEQKTTNGDTVIPDINEYTIISH